MTLIGKIFDQTYTGLTKTLDLSWRRNEALVSNVANTETPGYRAVDLNFAGELDKAFGKNPAELSLTNSKHMDIQSGGAAHLMEDFSGATKADGNNVDIDIQMGQMSYNGGVYSSASSLLRKKLGILKLAVRQGGQ